jgi:hypothetical protein
MPNTDRMREEFEAHVDNDLKLSVTRYPLDEPVYAGEYLYEKVRIAWKTWQAACRAQAKRDAEICRELAISSRHSAYGDDCAEAIRKEAGL